MAYQLAVTINEIQKKFLVDKELSPSLLLQEKINEIIREKDPQLYNSNLSLFTKRTQLTKWQTRLNEAKDYEERQKINLEFLEAIGVDMLKWQEQNTEKQEKC